MRDLHRRVLLLGVQTALLILGLLAVAGGVAFAVYERSEHVDAESRLHSAIERLAPGRTPSGLWLVVVDQDGRVESSPGLPGRLDLDGERARVAADGKPRQREVSTGSDVYFVRTEPRGDDVVQAVLDRTVAERSSERVVTALVLAGTVGALLAGLVAWLLARRTLRPVGEALVLQRRFVSDAGHELRTPLTLLSTRVQLLARKLDSGADVGKDVEGVLADAAALNEVLEDLLVVAHAGEAERTSCDLVGLVSSCVEAARAAAEERRLDLELVGSGRSEPAVATVGEPAVRRAVTALLDNALDHARSRVQVTVRSTERQVLVEVADDGAGVPPEMVEGLFDRFSSHRAATGSGRRHYGLGLALVAEVAQAHGGSVSLDPREEGSAFVLRLPRSR